MDHQDLEACNPPSVASTDVRSNSINRGSEYWFHKPTKIGNSCEVVYKKHPSVKEMDEMALFLGEETLRF